jgi:hypothetical protein
MLKLHDFCNRASSLSRASWVGTSSGYQIVRPSGFFVSLAILARCRLAAKPIEQVSVAPML